MKPLRRKGQPDTISVEAARRQFLNAYAAEKPALLGSLFESVLSVYALNSDHEYIDLWSAVESDLPLLRDTLASWATEFLLTFGGKPADWAMATALHTLWKWNRSSRHFKCICWHHASETLGEASEMAEEFPAGEAGYCTVTGESEVEQLAIRIAIPAWNRPNGETEQQFKNRFYEECDRAFQEHVREGNKWTERQQIQQPLYVDGLAMWQAGLTLPEIHSRLAQAGLDVGGSEPKDSDYNSAVSKGLDRIAKLIQLDRRA